jgi:GNAT superfamily N-acetyltransferase
MEIIVVTNRRQMQDFVRFPKNLYKDDPFWVPPLWHEERNAYDGRSNVMLRNNEYCLFLVQDEQKTVGRVIVYIDASFNSYYHTAIGFFGAFECIDNKTATELLLTATCNWLQARNIHTLRGPIHPIAESWGFLFKGYDSLPVLMAPYNPPYYHTLLETFGLKKIKDLLAYEADIDGDYHIPPRIAAFTNQLLKRRPNLSVRSMQISNLMVDAEHIWRISNTSIADNWGFVPVDISVMQDMVRRLKPLLDPNAIWFVEDNGHPVGYALGFPDPNAIFKDIKGRFFPFGFIKFLLGRRNIGRYRLFALGVLPEYHGMGLDVLLYQALYEALKGKGILLEANYILEDNYKIRNALEKLELKRTKEYRIYEKSW